MIPTILIGDLHADLDAYRSALKRHGGHPSIQVGDFGIGHLSPKEEAEARRLHTRTPHRFIRGNHDRPLGLPSTPGWIPDGTIWGDVLFLGGADPGEATQIAPDEMERLLARLRSLTELPRVVISHDAPQPIAAEVAAHVHRLASGSGSFPMPPARRPSRTRSFPFGRTRNPRVGPLDLRPLARAMGGPEGRHLLPVHRIS
ncbi:metallophosphoesterase [Cereibacter sphaeroides]|uniref:metallophosphoesterase n=1 Tax=Cereibacter sphaeroides TaxID=1063 RepID=UPI003AF1D5F9|nr:metallophosphoesterase [Cereibacter sphaeroides]